MPVPISRENSFEFYHIPTVLSENGLPQLPNCQIVIRFSGQTVAVFGISPVVEQSLANDSIQSVGTNTPKVVFTLL
jgi:hypothetical protein